MKYLSRFAGMVLAPGLALSAAAQEKPGPAPANDDRRTELRVRAAINKEHAFQGSFILTSVHDGILLVSGTVRSEAEKVLAVSELARVEGVRAVRDNIVVGQGTAADTGTGESRSPGSPATGRVPPSANGQDAPRTGFPANATSRPPAQLVGEWKSTSIILDVHSDGSFTQSSQRSDLFAYCGPTMTVVSVGTILLAGDRITISPSDGALYTQNSCSGASTKAHYVNRANDYAFALSQDGRRLVLTGPIGAKYSQVSEYHKTSR